jgi:sigma-B regulation protein RsbU (phosphoserine phosphatase)
VNRLFFILSSRSDYERTPVFTGRVFRGQVNLFVAFSDGVTEPENDSGECGEERLIALIQEHRVQPLSRIGDVITDAVVEWIGGAEQSDDVTVVLARAR